MRNALFWVITDVSGQFIGPNFKGQESKQLPLFAT